jgi:WD40 repeat protein
VLFALVALCGGGVAAPIPVPSKPKELRVLKGHEDIIESVAFSANGKRLLTAGRGDGTARLWDVETGKCLKVFKGHDTGSGGGGGSVSTAALSPDGKLVATGGDDLTARLWDVESGKNIATFPDKSYVVLVAFSPDSKSLFIRGREMKLVDLASKKARAVLADCRGWNHAAAFSPKGKLVVAAIDSRNYKEFSLWDGQTDKSIATCSGHTQAITCLALSRDATMVASAGRDHTIRLWDTATGKEKTAFKDQPGRICGLAISPDGKVVASGYKHQEADGVTDANPQRFSIRLLETATGKTLTTLTGDPGPWPPLAFSPSGLLLAACHRNRTITLWKLPEVWKPTK